MAANWPTVAHIISSGYSEEYDFGVVRSSMDGGLAKQRRKFSRAIVTTSLTFEVDSNEDKAIFDSWINDTIKMSLWFDFEIPYTGQIVTARITDDKFKWSENNGISWKASVKIEYIK